MRGNKKINREDEIIVKKHLLVFFMYDSKVCIFYQKQNDEDGKYVSF
jgi:hypothetical protein